MSGSACMFVRQYEYHSTLQHLLPPMYDFMIGLMRKKTFSFSINITYLSCSHHVNKLSTVLTAYMPYDMIHFVLYKNVFIIELVYVSLMSNPYVMNTCMFQLQIGQHLCVFISYKKMFL